jgi:tetratricopeptide (TPR) repeat protein
VRAKLRKWPEAAARFSRALQLNSNDWLAWHHRGSAHAELGQWPEAAADHEKAAALNLSNAENRYRHALLRLALGETAAYRKACSDMLQYFGASKEAASLNTVAWACVLAPDAVDQPARLVELAGRAVAEQPANPAYLGALGSAHYRAGQYDAALRRLTEAVQAHGKGGMVQDWLFLALAHQRLGDTGAARQWLEHAARWIERAERETPDHAAPRPGWNERLEWKVLRGEAESLLKATGSGSLAPAIVPP